MPTETPETARAARASSAIGAAAGSIRGPFGRCLICPGRHFSPHWFWCV